jgi:malate dehydrogenase
MATTPPIRVALSGAAGRVAYSLLFRMANGGLFGHEQDVALSLLDLPETMARLEARAMELKDCAFPLLRDVRIGTDPAQAFQGADWVILLGGKAFQPEVITRLDVLKHNAPIMVEHGRAINEASPKARVLVVASPCNTNCLIAMSQAMNVPTNHWFALNQVFRHRAIAMVADKAGVPVTQITRLTVWGNNSETAFVDLRNARIGHQPALQVINDEAWCKKVLEPAVAERAVDIMRRTGGSPAGSVAHAILTTIRAITTPTPFEHWFGAGVLSNGSYGVPRGLVFGFPLLTSEGKTWTIPEGHYLNEYAKERIAQNVAELELEASTVGHLLGRQEASWGTR